MANFKKKNYKFWHSPIALFIIFCLLALFAYKIIDLIKKERETSDKKELILKEIDDLVAKEKSLTEDISRLDTDAGKEEIIREKYQVAKEGEKMVIIVDEEEYNSSFLGEEVKHGFWNWIKKIFNK
jgi:cell division protein FtsB